MEKSDDGEGKMGAKEIENHRDWADLTHVCLINVLSRVGHEDRWKGPMLVCRSWLHASKDPSLFSTFDLEPRFQSTTSEDSPLWWRPDFEAKIDGMLRSAVDWSEGRIEEIRVRHCSDRSLAFAAERSPNLQVLSIKSCPNVTDTSIAKIASRCCMLRELDISYCYEISYKSLELIGRGCPNLKVLKRNLMNWLDPSQHSGIVPSAYLNALPQDGDREASVIAEHMCNLEHLELKFSKMSDKGLALISDGCGSLEHLDLFGCANLRSQAMEHAFAKLKNLKKLVRPNFFIPRSSFNAERYGHWRLYDERFQTGAFFQI
ncbi:F-box protein SKIP1-like [Magnolia sinica]|uniref:F-box protein SKIP1-like n=1 Tax=Magnolia sinica TaxID=86752 RepID=UPI002657D372|nr:F-box protein SKIP1-like [Magnolia sinica]